jgi:hypothetical protein
MKLNENLNYQDLAGQVISTVSIDEYSAKVGSDDDIVTLAFIVRGEAASNDLVDWFELGYEWVLDAQISDSEYVAGKYLVFVEIARRTTTPERIIELLDDLETLTNITLDEWVVKFDNKDYPADVQQLKSIMELSPKGYREKHEDELNEMRNIAGLSNKNSFNSQDSLLRDFITKAGL